MLDPATRHLERKPIEEKSVLSREEDGLISDDNHRRPASVIGDEVLLREPIEVSDHPVIGRFSPSGDGFVLVGTPPALDCAIAVSWIHRELRTCVR